MDTRLFSCVELHIEGADLGLDLSQVKMLSVFTQDKIN